MQIVQRGDFGMRELKKGAEGMQVEPRILGRGNGRLEEGEHGKKKREGEG